MPGPERRLAAILSADVVGSRGSASESSYGGTAVRCTRARLPWITIGLLVCAGCAGTSYPLHVAAIHDDTDALSALIDDGSDVNERGLGGLTPLISAAMEGRSEAVRLLLSRGADVDARADSGFTALVHAAKRGHTDTVRVLLQHGASLEYFFGKPKLTNHDGAFPRRIFSR